MSSTYRAVPALIGAHNTVCLRPCKSHVLSARCFNLCLEQRWTTERHARANGHEMVDVLITSMASE